MRTTRIESKTNCTAIVCFEHVTILDSRKTVVIAMSKKDVHPYVWRENLKACSGCTVKLEYHNYLLEQIIVVDRNEEIIAHFEF